MSILLLLTAVMVGIVNCGDESNDATLLSVPNREFSAKMFLEVAKKNACKSFVLSAFSVLTALAQLSLASEGKTHDELLEAIGLPDDQTIKSVFVDMNSKFRSIKGIGIDLKMASRIYVDNKYSLKDEFAAMSKYIFQSEVKNVNFSRSIQTAEEINNWVEDQTNHRIKDLVNSNSLTSDTSVILVNAIYLKGTWKYRFQELFTRPRDFHVSSDKTVKILTMYRKGNYNFGESDALDAKILELLYVDDESALYIILPNKVDGIHDLQNKLRDSSVLENILNSLYVTQVEVHIPKYKIETTTNLKEVLRNMGVKEIFRAEANLTKLVNKPNHLYVSEAVQKAFIEINEEGAEAAAANDFHITFLSPMIPQTKTFIADHPFVYVLRIAGNIIFSGVFYG